MDFREGFTIWRELGQGRGGASLPFAALTAIHVVHRLAAFVVIAAALALAWWLWRAGPVWRGSAQALALLVLWQFLTGLSNVVLDWPLLAAVGHTGGAAGLVLVLTGLLARTRNRVPAAASPLSRQPVAIAR